MKVDIYEADPFTQRKDKLLVTLNTEYRFQKGDEVFIEEGGKSVKVRVSYLQVRVKGGTVEQELLALRL
jgi:argonaute-like protein implicated in RNA metabolism and viral defense